MPFKALTAEMSHETNACFGPMLDGEALQELHAADIGERVHIAVGKKPTQTSVVCQFPLRVNLYLSATGISPEMVQMIHGIGGCFGPTTVLHVGGIEILVVTIPRQIF